MDLMVAISAATKAMEGVKLLRDIEKSFDESEYKIKIADILSNMADLKIAILEAKDTIAGKDEELTKLRQAFAFKFEKTVAVRGFTYEQDSKGGPQGMPFCPRCETIDGRLIRIVGTRSKEKGGGYVAMCPQCKADFGLAHGYTYESDR